jgi:hypothetical protein
VTLLLQVAFANGMEQDAEYQHLRTERQCLHSTRLMNDRENGNYPMDNL